MNHEKLAFLQIGYMPLVSKINVDTLPLWGKMNAQQMVEHVAAFFKVSSGKLKIPLSTPAEQHPVFGDLNFEEWVLLNHKHVVHHLKQFGVDV